MAPKDTDTGILTGEHGGVGSARLGWVRGQVATGRVECVVVATEVEPTANAMAHTAPAPRGFQPFNPQGYKQHAVHAQKQEAQRRWERGRARRAVTAPTTTGT